MKINKEGLIPLLMMPVLFSYGYGVPFTDLDVDEKILKVTFKPQFQNIVPLIASTPQGTQEGQYIGQLQVPKHIKSIDRCITLGFSSAIGSSTNYYKCEKQSSTGLFSMYLFSCPPGNIFNEVSNLCQLISLSDTTIFNFPKSTNVTLSENRNELSFNTEIDYSLQKNETENSTIKKMVLENYHTVVPSVIYIHNSNKNNDAKSTEVSLRENNYYDVSFKTKMNPLQQVVSNPVIRKKRFLGFLLGGLIGGAVGYSAGRGSRGSSKDYTRQLQNIENKLVGIQGGINNINMNMMLNQIENRMQHNITQNLMKHNHLETMNKLGEIHDSIIESRIINQENFNKVQLSIKDMRMFMVQEIGKAKKDVKQGFESVLDSIDKSRTEPLISELLTLIRVFNQKTKHLGNLPLKSRKDEIERIGGYLSYLESNTLQFTLNDIIRQQFAIPDGPSDVSAIFILDWLVHGLEVYTAIHSSIVSSNVFLAHMALEEISLDSFNTYMGRVSSSIERVKINLHENNGIIGEIESVLGQVEAKSFASDISGLTELLSVKRADIEQIRSDIKNLIEVHSEIKTPGIIVGRPDFVSSTIAVPIGSWERGKTVRYAVQFVTKEGLSKIGDWSSPFTIQDKANPVIKLSLVENGVIRIVYRQFDEEKPERVAVITDNTQASFRDINRDLLNAASRANTELAFEETKKLSNGNIDVNVAIEDGMTALHYAAKQCNLKVMETLIAKGANVNAKAIKNMKSLHFASSFGNIDCIKYLLQKGARINEQTEPLRLSPLHIAVVNEHGEAVKELIRNGASINIKNREGLTPLHVAATGNGQTIDILLENVNVNINAIDDESFTPLHYAAAESSGLIVQKLLSHGNINANPLTKSHFSPMHVAARAGYVSIISQLARKGAPILALDKDGSAPIHYAAFYGNKEAVQWFIEKDYLSASIKNQEGKTALDIAVETEKQDVIDILVKQIKCGVSYTNALIKSKEDTCNNINYIDAYIDLVKSMQELNEVYANDKDLAELSRKYRDQLAISKREAYTWENGNSIIKGINDLFSHTKLFDLSFNLKYKNYRKLREGIVESINQMSVIDGVKKQITLTEEKIERMSHILNMAGRVSAVLTKKFEKFKKDLKLLKRKLQKDFSVLINMKNLYDSLEYGDLEELANLFDREREQLESFRQKLTTSRSAWQNVKALSQDSSGDQMKIIGTMLASQTNKNNVIFLLQSDIANDRDMFELVKSKIVSRSNEMAAYIAQLSGGSANVLVKTDLNGAIILETTKLKILTSRLSKVVTNLDKAIEGTNFIITSFRDLSQKVRDISQFYQEAKTEAGKKNAKYFAYQDFSNAACRESVIFKNLRDINECAMYSQIL